MAQWVWPLETFEGSIKISCWIQQLPRLDCTGKIVYNLYIYSTFNNYVVEISLSLVRKQNVMGTLTMFLLVNYWRYDFGFFYTSKYEIFAVTKKDQIFIFNGFSWYLTPNMALQTIILINLGNSEITVSSSGTDGSGTVIDFWLLNNCEPRHPFFYTSKYGKIPVCWKKFKFLSLRVLLIFDSKHGAPENYSFFFFTSSRMRATQFPRHKSSKIIEQSGRIFADMVQEWILLCETRFVHLRTRGFISRGPQTWNFFWNFPCVKPGGI